MRVSVIDIGTNSIRQLICDIESGTIKKRSKDVEITRLGEGIAKTKKLNSNAILRSIEVLEKYIKAAKDQNVDAIYAFATSAMRDARNKELFFDEIKKQGIDVEIIDGKTESLYGYIGATYGVNRENTLVIDIGGGSTELAYKGEEFVKESFDIGAVRLTEKFVRNDPLSSDEYNEIRLHIIDMLLPAIDRFKEPKSIIGIGGTITTLAAVAQELVIYSSDKVHGYELKKDEIKRILDRFMKLKLEDRKLIPGLQPERADIITAGTIILITILEMLNLKLITVSEWDNLEGALLCKFANSAV